MPAHHRRCCGNGRKLAALHPTLQIVGIDHGPNLEQCREEHPLDIGSITISRAKRCFPSARNGSRAACSSCADVIEHLVGPERSLRNLRRALEVASCVVISTPERELMWETGHPRAIPKPAYVREWAQLEFVAFLCAEGFVPGVLTLTRSRDRLPDRNTILPTLSPDTERTKRYLYLPMAG